MAYTILNTGVNQEKGVTYTATTDDSNDWNDVDDNTYFYDFETDLPYYKDSSGNVFSVFSTGGSVSTIYSANDTVGTGRVVTLTDTLRFKDGTFEIQGTGTTTETTLALYDSQEIPNKTWEWLDDGSVNIGQDTILNNGSDDFTFSGTGLTKIVNGTRSIGVDNWNVHTRWALNNGNGTTWTLISANNSTTFNQDEFAITNGTQTPIRINNLTSVAIGDVSKVDLDTTYKVQAQVDNANSRINGRDTDYRACSVMTLMELIPCTVFKYR